MKLKGFTMVEVLIVVAIVGILFAILMLNITDKSDRSEFMKYCMDKGNSEQDCKWEWKRMQNCHPSALIIPMNMRR
jgi:prepilin-type N-terminal cleavage/methylation domain-containing protein